jgi:hypothetical protein
MTIGLNKRNLASTGREAARGQRLRLDLSNGYVVTGFNSSGAISKKTFMVRCEEAISRKLWPLDADALCAAARRRAGFEDFGDPAIESRLSILLKSLKHEADLRPRGRLLAWIHLCGLLETRLRLERLWQKSGSAGSEPVKRPIFITGMPRSGSTFLHELLAQDGDNRAPLVWEVMSPLPSGDRRRIWSTAACLWWFRRMAPEADSVHPLRATMPHECVAIHSYTLLSREFITTFRVPAYEKFLEDSDFAPAYAWQKKFLQYLQSASSPRRWVLKAPDHVYNLESLLRIFPDAIVIQTHRDPLEVLESSSRLTEVVHRLFAHPQDRRELGIREARILADGMDRINRFRQGHPELAGRFFDVNYNELASHPIDTVRRVYRQLDLPLTHTTLERVRKLASHRSRYGRRRDRPTLLDFGLNLELETRRFAPYCTRFGIGPAERSDA